MILKTIHLVREVELSHSLTAVLDFPATLEIETDIPAELWSCLTQHSVVPQLTDETDYGIDVFSSDYDPVRDADLPVVGLPGVDTSPSISHQRDKTTLHRVAKIPRKSPNAVRRVVLLERRSTTQFEVKRLVVKANSTKALADMCGDDLWWDTSVVPAEIDEVIDQSKCKIETNTYDHDLHRTLPFVRLHSLVVPDDMPPTQEFLSGWQPSSTGNKKNKRESVRVGRLVKAEEKQCYFNARKVMRSLPDYRNARYVEGYFVGNNGLIGEHGWIVKDGEIVDPTLFGDVAYFPGLEFCGREQIQAFLRTPWGNSVSGRAFHFAFRFGGCHSPSFLAAYRQAFKYMRSRSGQAIDNDAERPAD